MPLLTLNIQFINGCNDLGSAFLHIIWGNYNTRIESFLIERVLLNHWACILDLGQKKLFCFLNWNEGFFHFISVYEMVMGHKKVSGNCEESHLVLCTSERTEAKDLWMRHRGSLVCWLGWERWLCRPDSQSGNIFYSSLKMKSLFPTICLSSFPLSLSISFLICNFSPISIPKRRIRNKTGRNAAQAASN